MSGFIFEYLPQIPHLTLALNLYLPQKTMTENIDELKLEHY